MLPSSKTALLNPLAGLDAETLGGHAEGASEGGWAAEENGRTRGIFLEGLRGYLEGD